MLNLPIAMMRVMLILFTFFSVMLQPQTTQTPAPEIQVTSPLPGAALQGAVAITGSTDLPGLQSAEVDFSYPDGGPGGWFLIAQGESSIKDGVLGVWDTSKIADGNYSLRLQVTLTDGSKVEKTVLSLRVRNYTAIETSTPLPIQQTRPVLAATAAPTAAVTATPQPTPTALPANPANMNPMVLGYNMVLGITASIIVFGLLGLYRWLKAGGRSH